LKFKNIIRQIHLWLGLSSGLVVFIVSITGAIWCWETEIKDLTYPYRKVAEHGEWLPPSQLFTSIPDSLSHQHKRWLFYYGKNRNAEIALGEMNETPIFISVDPYNGELLNVTTGRNVFFDVILDIHMRLMMGKFGEHIVSYATLIFFFMLVSGIILWWPKNKKAAKQRFWFRWKPTLKWRRKNYDLHNILGFYACWILVFIAITGLAWSFQWVDKTIYYTSTLGSEDQGWPAPKSDPQEKQLTSIHDDIFKDALSRSSQPVEAYYYYMASDSLGANTAYTCPKWNIWWSSVAYHYDQYSGELLLTDDVKTMNNGRKLRKMYYDIHIGKILGLPGQLLAFFASLISASLPVTGFLIWWGRRKKKKPEPAGKSTNTQRQNTAQKLNGKIKKNGNLDNRQIKKKRVVASEQDISPTK